MDRRNFIKTSCLACSSIGLLSIVIQSCGSVKYTSGQLTANGLIVNLDLFKSRKGTVPYIIVRHDDLQYPICVYRINETTFSALLMQCSHQGAELQVAGDTLTCPAHGSEFDKWGNVAQGPAGTNLRTFPVTITTNELFIDLRKQG